MPDKIQIALNDDRKVALMIAAMDAAAKITSARIDAGKTTLNTSTAAANDLVHAYRVIMDGVIK